MIDAISNGSSKPSRNRFDNLLTFVARALLRLFVITMVAAAAAAAASASASHAPLRVQVGSYNFNLQGTTVPFPNLQSWLVPTLSETRTEYTSTSMSAGRDAPDIYAVGFQELLPLHMAFADSTRAYEVREHTSREIRRAVRHHAAVTRPDGMYPSGSGPEDYTVIAEVHLVSISLFVFGRNRSGIPARVKEVRTSTASTGFFNLLGNKGGVGARIVLNSQLPGNSSIETEQSEEVLTFVCAHLTAHDHNTLRRNADFKTIVSRLAFTPESAIAIPEPNDNDDRPDLTRSGKDANELKDQYESRVNAQRARRLNAPTGRAAALDKKTYSLYDSHHVFFFGDLNYRLALDSGPDSLKKTDVQRKIGQEDFTYLAKYDQLVREHRKENVLNGFSEYALAEAKIPPTYKYKPVRKSPDSSSGGEGKSDEKKESFSPAASKGNELSGKRIPGWTDRIFWASAGSGSGSTDNDAHQGVSVELFRSLMSYNLSDHKPVTALLKLSQPAPHTPLLTSRNPHAFDGSHALYRNVGLVLDRLVGYVWSLLVLMGAGNFLVGASQIVVGIAFLAWFVVGRDGGGGGDLGYWLGTLNLRP